MEAGVYNLAETVLTTSLVIQQRGFVKMVVTLAGREISVIPLVMMENGHLTAFRTVPIVLVTRSVILLMDTVLRAVRRDGHCQVVTQVFFFSYHRFWKV